ncbi:MAG: flagellin [Phycisphaerae bacterium]|nr:flagellin [Phycisphaerae bacterium]
MSRITNNIPAVVAQRHLGGSQKDLRVSLERLSSGLRINRGADDPAGLIVSERLRSEINAVGQAVKNSERAINVIATTEGALNEVSALLNDINALLIEAANKGAFSDEEVAANQLQIDSAIDSINRIANTTTFAGRKLLDGSLDYVTSGVNWNTLADVQILGAKFGSREYVDVDVIVTSAAQPARMGFGFVAGQVALGGDGLYHIGSAVTIDIQGVEGVATLNFPASASIPDIVRAINTQTDATGVMATSATVGGTAGAGVEMHSRGYGSDQFVRVQEVYGSGPFSTVDLLNHDNDDPFVPPERRRAEGHDAEGTINGAPTVGKGLVLQLNSFLLDVTLTLDETFGIGSTTFAITGGGSLFQLGPRINTNQQENIGVRAMHANKLGNRVVGFLSWLQDGQQYALRNTQNLQRASDAVNAAIDQVSVLRGRLGAFERNTLQANIAQLQITAENLTSSESVIRDTDFAEETTELTRAQVLVQAGNSILAIANAQQQNVLSLLGG